MNYLIKLIRKLGRKNISRSEIKNPLITVKPKTIIEGKKKGIIFFPDWSYYNSYQKLLYQTINSIYNTSSYGFEPDNLNKECLEQYRTKANILHLHWINVFYKLDDENSIEHFYYTLEQAKHLGYKIIWTIHNFVSHESKNYNKEIEIRKRVSFASDHIIVHGQYAKDIVNKEYGVPTKKIRIIPHGHYIGYYKNDINKIEARKKLSIEKNDFVYLFFGNIRAYKGLEDLVESFIKINNKHVNTTLLIAGRGLDKEIVEYLNNKIALNNKIIAHIEFINDEDVQVYLNAADIMVLPYKNILTSGVALLALSFNLPVIAPSMGLIPELVENKIGFLFKTHEIMEDIMFRCVENDELKLLSKDDFKKKAEDLSWEKILNNDFFNTLLNKD